MSESESDVRSIFCEAVELSSPEAVEQFLGAACRGNSDLRLKIEELISVHRGAGNFLGATMECSAALELKVPGAIIGPYKLRERLGEGGMGIVYAAEQEQPVRRKVALKLIKPGMDSREVIARFEAERQALAMMDHQNIARVLDAGTTDAGLPYFVMELVRGVSVTKYCDKNKLSIRERLELFVQICKAVQHAHQKGIIHRDIKPSNVMITLHDGVPVPKVIDFGVAKAINQRLSEGTVYTKVAQVLGTPAYMSPEQAELSGLDIDTRSDIYSLGVLLYELLTGSTPFTKDELSKASFDEMRRVIRETDPQRPSDRVSTLQAEAMSTVADRRCNDPRTLANSLRGELDWIVMKALEKDRTKRYETSTGMAADVKRYLDDEPVLACPPTAIYRFQKYAKRNKVKLAITSMIGMFLIVGFVGLVVGNYLLSSGKKDTQAALNLADENLGIAQKNLKLAIKSEQKAKKRLTQLINANEIIISIFDELEIKVYQDNVEPLETVLAKRLVDAGNQLTVESLGDPLIVADMQEELGCALASLGFYKEAYTLSRESFGTRSTILGPVHRDTLESMIDVGSFLRHVGRLDEAVPMLEQALELALEELVSDDKLIRIAMSNLAGSYHEAKRYQQALVLHGRLLEIEKSLYGPDDEAVHFILNNIAAGYMGMGQIDDEIAQLEPRIGRMRTILGDDHETTVNAISLLAKAYFKNKKFAEALPLMTEAAEFRKRRYGADHPKAVEDTRVLAIINGKLGQFEVALPLMMKVLENYEERFGPDHPSTSEAREKVSVWQNELGVAYWKSNRLEKSIPLFEAILQREETNLGNDHQFVVVTKMNLGANYLDVGRIDDAVPLLEESYQAIKEHRSYSVMGLHLIEAYMIQGRGDDAAVVVKELTKGVASQTRDPSVHAKLLGRVCQIYFLPNEDFAQAESHLREALMISEKSSDSDTWRRFDLMFMLGEALLRQEDIDSAEPLLIAGYKGLYERHKNISSKSKLRIIQAIKRIEKFYDSQALMRPDGGFEIKANRWKKEAEKLESVLEKDNQE